MLRAYGPARTAGGVQGGPVGASLHPVWLLGRKRRIVDGMSDKSRLVVIVGSVREGRFGPVVASWVADQIRAHGGFDVDLVDLAGVDIPLTLPAASPKFAGDDYPRPEGMKDLTRKLSEADAFIIVTPEYNHSYPASLKALIDWHFTQWTAKPVAFVSYGGAAGGRHAVLHLENVLTELHAVTIRDGLTFPNYFTAWKDGTPLDAAAAGYAKTLLEQLSWWAQALRAARTAVPYPGGA
ncbi:NADPH-dependent FMN reductase [Actinoplanes rectilineatus]|uniref:NADPH-dependent FMN reductase n=1 Tax=Actinoplanes rectilineatus TaxID=113571 RepID=UPI001FE06710|nr:NAD(P)H-dependent oxidoreductase [Actinoplanes rectilineatus]